MQNLEASKPNIN